MPRAAPLLDEQRPVEPLLEAPHVHGDGALGLVHPVGGAREAAGVHDGQEGAELVGVEHDRCRFAMDRMRNIRWTYQWFGATLVSRAAVVVRPIEGTVMLLMLERPRRSPAERAFAILSRLAAAALATADAVIMWPFRMSENRRILDSLGAMDDHQLRDIGLSRQDLRDATALGADRDPGRFFSARRHDRRLWH